MQAISDACLREAQLSSAVCGSSLEITSTSQVKANTRQRPEKPVMALTSTAEGWGESQETGKYLAYQISGAGLDCQAATEKSWQPVLSKWRNNFHLLNSAGFPAVEFFPTPPVWGSFPFFQGCLLHTILRMLSHCQTACSASLWLLHHRSTHRLRPSMMALVTLADKNKFIRRCRDMKTATSFWGLKEELTDPGSIS